MSGYKDESAVESGGIRTQKTLIDPKISPLRKYSLLVTGTKGILQFVKYEFLTFLLIGMPGLLGLYLRQVFYRFLFKKMGRGTVIGRNVTIRHPDKILLGNRIVIEDEVVLDAKGDEEPGLIIHDGVFIGRGSIISARSGQVEIGEECSISSYCRIGRSKIGRKVLIAAYAYLVGGGHRSERVDIPIIDQPIESKGGVEIGDGAWIGAFTALLDGVKVGDNAIVGAHSVVTHDIPSFSISFGIPAQVYRDRRETSE